MSALYLYVNAVLYGVFAVWCTFGMSRTAPAMGFTALTHGGRSAGDGSVQLSQGRARAPHEESPELSQRNTFRPEGRIFFVGLSWSMAGAKKQAPERFEYEQ